MAIFGISGPYLVINPNTEEYYCGDWDGGYCGWVKSESEATVVNWADLSEEEKDHIVRYVRTVGGRFVLSSN